jgi:hypothetical protein
LEGNCLYVLSRDNVDVLNALLQVTCEGSRPGPVDDAFGGCFEAAGLDPG